MIVLHVVLERVSPNLRARLAELRGRARAHRLLWKVELRARPRLASAITSMLPRITDWATLWPQPFH